MTSGLPNRYRVTITSVTGGSTRYHAVTWRGPQKAAALAGIAHREQRREHPFDVVVEDRGPVDQDDAGVAVVLPTDLVDRQEW